MNQRLQRGLIVAVVHVALVASLGAKLFIDRATLPRVWVRTVPVDPEAFIRGRYVSLGVEVDMPAGTQMPVGTPQRLPVFLAAQNGRLKAEPRSDWASDHWLEPLAGRPGSCRLQPPLAFFIPEKVPDPSRRPRGEELWVEVTVTRGGQLRPIRLGIRKDGVLRGM